MNPRTKTVIAGLALTAGIALGEGTLGNQTHFATIKRGDDSSEIVQTAGNTHSHKSKGPEISSSSITLIALGRRKRRLEAQNEMHEREEYLRTMREAADSSNQHRLSQFASSGDPLILTRLATNQNLTKSMQMGIFRSAIQLDFPAIVTNLFKNTTLIPSLITEMVEHAKTSPGISTGMVFNVALGISKSKHFKPQHIKGLLELIKTTDGRVEQTGDYEFYGLIKSLLTNPNVHAEALEYALDNARALGRIAEVKREYFAERGHNAIVTRNIVLMTLKHRGAVNRMSPPAYSRGLVLYKELEEPEGKERVLLKTHYDAHIASMVRQTASDNLIREGGTSTAELSPKEKRDAALAEQYRREREDRETDWKTSANVFAKNYGEPPIH